MEGQRNIYYSQSWKHDKFGVHTSFSNHAQSSILKELSFFQPAMFLTYASSFCFFNSSNLNCFHFLCHNLSPFVSHNLLFSLIYQYFSLEFTSEILLAKSKGSISIVILSLSAMMLWFFYPLQFFLSLASADTALSGFS